MKRIGIRRKNWNKDAKEKSIIKRNTERKKQTKLKENSIKKEK